MANEGSTKPTYSELERKIGLCEATIEEQLKERSAVYVELARVRGLLQRALNTIANAANDLTVIGRDCPQAMTIALELTKMLVGSAETGGEKAANGLPQTAEGWHEFYTNKIRSHAWVTGVRAKDWGDGSFEDALTAYAEAYVVWHAEFAIFPRSSQNQTAASGVEGVHEGITADKSGLLPTQLPKSDH